MPPRPLAGLITVVGMALPLVHYNSTMTLAAYALLGIGFCCSCVFPIVYGLALKRRPEKSNEISGLMIMAVAGGTVSFLVGAANEQAGIMGGALVIALEIAYLTYCAFFVKSASSAA